MVLTSNTDRKENIHITKFQQVYFIRMKKVISNPRVRECAIKMILSATIQYLDIILAKQYVQDREYNKPISEAMILLDWKFPNFRKRLHAQTSGIEALAVEHPRTLELWKIHMDITNIKNIIVALAKGELKWAYVTLMGCHKLVHILHNLLRIHNHYNNMQTHYSFQCVVVIPSKTERLLSMAKKKLRATIDYCMDTQRVADPIILRYIRNYELVALSGKEYNMMLKEKGIMDATDQLIDTTEKVDFVFKNTMNFLSNQIEIFRRNINYWGWKYETDYDKLENEVAQSDMTLKTLQSDVKFHKERLQFFRNAIWKHFDLIRQKEEELEQQRLEELQRQLELEQSKKSTPRSKGKGKENKGKGKGKK